MQNLDVKKMSKAGVSLIAVLLFMLIATIAATATWKWITSEGRSSESRMLQREAYQSTQAGIENARAWMTFHGNDVGALIKQYLDDPDRKPINMDKRLRTLQRPGQDYHVWLTGVNTEQSTYKLKILSQGEARNNTRYSETAIFNVDGLYRVKVPVQERGSLSDFDYPYFGGGVTGTDTYYESAVINGNWTANPPTTDRNWVVTGNASLSGSTITVGRTGCIGGDLNADNGIVAENLLVNGDITGTALSVRVTENAYIGGDMVVGNQPIQITGNLTMEGKIKTNPSAVTFDVGGNLCVGDTGTLVHGTGTDNNPTTINGNVWMPGNLNVWYNNVVCSGGKRKECICEKTRVVSYYPYQEEVQEVACNKMGMIGHEGPFPIKSCSYVDHPACNLGEFNCHCFGHVLTASEDNFSSYKQIVLGKNSGSDVYIKSGNFGSNYDSRLRDKSFTENASFIKKCEGLSKNCSSPTYWGGGDPYQPYVLKENIPADAYYIYYMPEGVKDVDFAEFTDTYWKACTQRDYWGHCTAYNSEGTQMYAYMINAPINNYTDTSTFTDSYHSTKEGHRVNIAHKGHYRFLNHNGTNITGSPFCYLDNDDEWRPTCGVSPWFTTNGNLHNALPPTRPFACAESVKNTCDSIWVQEDGCDGASYKVPDPLVTAYETFKKYATKGCAASITSWSSGLVGDLNDCYNDHKSDDAYVKENFYNGFVVVHLSSVLDANVGGTLNGKFVIIVDEKINAQNAMITAGNGSYVFLYLKKGASYLQGTANNVFIYSEGKITETSKLNLKGTFYTPTDSCIKVRFENSRLEFSRDLVDVLSNAKVICANDGYTCGEDTPASSSSSAQESSSSTAEVVDGYDTYHISMAPQLGVRLESKHKNMERVPKTRREQSDLDSSFIVLPRVIYLPSDPYGELKDYYNVVPLNGSHLTKAKLTSVSCSGPSQLPTGTNQKMYDGDLLGKGTYRCVAKADGYYDVPFWVYVGDTQRNTPEVHFVEESQEIPKTSVREVHAYIPAHGNELTLVIDCPDAPSGWGAYTLASEGTRDPDTKQCTFVFSGTEDVEPNKLLFTVSNSAGDGGTLRFIIVPGEGYIPGTPYVSDLVVASTAIINRTEATEDEIDEFCEKSENSGKCPSNIVDWPDCVTSTPAPFTWVEPNMAAIPVEVNNSWKINVGGSGSVKLSRGTGASNCVVIIPTTNNSISMDDIVEGSTHNLRASAKVIPRTLTVGFVGVSSLDPVPSPVLTIRVNGDEKTCSYESVKANNPQTCTFEVFDNQNVELSINLEDNDNKQFSYWKCDQGNCPTEEPVSSATYGTTPFKISSNVRVMAHFGESDKHCFFDEFKMSSLNCLPTVSEYCVDICGTEEESKCDSVTDTRGIQISKWRLLSGKLENITREDDGYIHLNASGSNRGYREKDRKAVVVMSSVAAGVKGTLKALINVPQETPTVSKSETNIAQSGFILHSDADADKYMMLNLYENTSGYLEARLCQIGRSNRCKTGVLEQEEGSANMKVSGSTMVMMSATFTDDSLRVSAFTGTSYYGSPTAYEYRFYLNDFLGAYSDYNHEYVGISLADENFKIYGVGWKSDDYNSECHDTYPTVKCSFQAVATDGVIPLDENIVPWVGHSGWFTSKECTPNFYYFGGSDANCSVGSTCSSYKFSSTGAGLHGYRDTEERDVKTAKAWLSCLTMEDEEVYWNWEKTSDYAHCGLFWTGAFTECGDHADLWSGNKGIEPDAEESIAIDENLRGATLRFVFESADENYALNEVEIWLTSKNETWGADDYNSYSVRMNYQSFAEFDVANEFVPNVEGFDPEHVTAIVIKNHGPNEVKLKSIVSRCKNAIEVQQCSAEYDGSQWQISSKLSGKDFTGLQIAVTSNLINSIPNDAYKGLTPEGVATFAISDNPYSNVGTDYTFTVSARVGNSTGEKECDVKQIKPVESACELVDVADAYHVKSGLLWPKFKFTLSGDCPSGGCTYKVMLGADEVTTASTTSGAGPMAKGGNVDECASSDGCEYTYKVESTSNPKLFEDCTASFTVDKTESSSSSAESSSSEIELTVECGPIANQTDKEPGTTIEVTPSMVSGCGNSDCSYTVAATGHTISPATSTTYNGGKVSFTDNDASGTVAYTLTISHGTASEICSFSVTYLAPSSSSEAESSSSNEEASSSSEQSSSSVVSSFPCNDGNSYTIARESEETISGGSCIKYTMDGSSHTLQIGSWYAPSTPVSVLLRKCDGTTTTISHACDGWKKVNVGGNCSIYLKPEKEIKWKFNNGDW